MAATGAVRARVVADGLVVLRGGDPLAGLFRAAMRVGDVGGSNIAVVGGFAVTCRLQWAHRATQDVDAVAETSTPSLIEVLARLPGIKQDTVSRERIDVDGVKVDLISTADVSDVEGLEDRPRLFVLAHRFALDAAEQLRVIIETGSGRVEGALRVATPAALVATKLHAIQDRRPQREHKRASDAYDLYRLLADLDGEGRIAAAIFAEGEPLRRCVRDAAATVLVHGVARTVGALRVYGDAVMGDVTEDDLAFVGERFVDRL